MFSEKRYACLVALSLFDQTCSKTVLLGNIFTIYNLLNLLSSSVNYFIHNLIIAFCLNFFNRARNGLQSDVISAGVLSLSGTESRWWDAILSAVWHSIINKMYYKVSGVTGKLTGATAPSAYSPQVLKPSAAVLWEARIWSDLHRKRFTDTQTLRKPVFLLCW